MGFLNWAQRETEFKCSDFIFVSRFQNQISVGYRLLGFLAARFSNSIRNWKRCFVLPGVYGFLAVASGDHILFLTMYFQNVLHVVKSTGRVGLWVGLSGTTVQRKQTTSYIACYIWSSCPGQMCKSKQFSLRKLCGCDIHVCKLKGTIFNALSKIQLTG